MIRTERSHLVIKALSHPGMTGKNNEDRYAVSAYQLGPDDPTSSVFAILSDGIGGHKAGEVAAEMVVESISKQVAASDGSRPTQTLQDAITEASQQVYAYAQQNGNLQGMGATCACVWVIGNRLYLTAIGDSRIYLMRSDTILQLTTDHTWVQEAIDKGVLKREEVRGHPNAHVIRRFVGSPTPPQVDLRLRLSPEEDDLQAEANQGLRLRSGDRLLICSDGLTDLVQDAEILGEFSKNEQEAAVQSLVDLACQRGGHDNITLIAIEVPNREAGLVPPPEKEAATAPIRTVRKRTPWAAIGCGGLFLAAVLAALAFYSLGGLSILGLDAGATLPAATTTLTLPPELSTVLPGEGTEDARTPSPIPTQLFPTRSATPRPALPGGSGPTYTPWPTNTLAPLPSPTTTPTLPAAYP